MQSTLLLAFVSAGVMLLNKFLSGVWMGARVAWAPLKLSIKE
jgi:hypothetical protein